LGIGGAHYAAACELFKDVSGAIIGAYVVGEALDPEDL
jgi:hypothetical protein